MSQQQRRNSKRFNVTVLFIFCAALICFALMTSSKAAVEGIAGLSKNADGAYLITSSADLAAFRDAVNSSNDVHSADNALLAADIDLEGVNWVPIGAYSDSEADYKPYSGVFDGQWHSIKGLYISTDASFQGLFGYIAGESASVKNLAVEGSVRGNDAVGHIAGWLAQGSIKDCSAAGSVAGNGNTGGIAGSAGAYAEIRNCTVSGSVSSKSGAGGVVGLNNGLVFNCVASVSDSAANSSDTYGGIAGYNNFGSITNCASSGPSTAINSAGGIAGANLGGTITNCAATGHVSCGNANYSGGIAGISDKDSTITNCGWLNTCASRDVGEWSYDNVTSSDITSFDQAALDAGKITVACLPQKLTLTADSTGTLKLAVYPSASPDAVTPVSASVKPETLASVSIAGKTVSVKGGSAVGTGMLTTNYKLTPTWFKTSGSVASTSTDVEISGSSMLTVIEAAPVSPDHSGSGGCSAGLAGLALLALPFVIKKKK